MDFFPRHFLYVNYFIWLQKSKIMYKRILIFLIKEYVFYEEK